MTVCENRRTGADMEPDRERDKDGRTPLAIALSYDGAGIPSVAASGRGAVAEQILSLAFASGVRVREDADLAQLLSLVDIGDEIPVEAFVAVAEVLAYVYRMNGQAGWARPR